VLELSLQDSKTRHQKWRPGGSFPGQRQVTAKQLPGTVFIPYHFAQPGVHELTKASQPYACVKIEKQN
jgi:hypothetical protein